MASPRHTISKLTQHHNLSPHALENLFNTRNSLSPRTPTKHLNVQTHERETKCKRQLLPFNIDTPNRAKIINNSLSNEERLVLGYGGFGTVYKASYKGDEVAVKMIKRGERSDVSVKAEKCACNLINKNIIRILSIEQGTVWSFITMELCSLSLEQKLEEMILQKNERISIWKAITCALQFCHDSGVIHADIKPKNILIALNGEPKLADFGSSVIINETDEKSNTMVNSTLLHGTPGYVAPEVIKGCRPNANSDIYSLGILAWQLLARESPFAGYHSHTILYLTGTGKRPTDENIDDEYDGKYKTLYKQLWSQNPQIRPPLNIIIEQLQKFS